MYLLFEITTVHKELSTLLDTTNRCMQDAHTYFLSLACFSGKTCLHLQIYYDCFTMKVTYDYLHLCDLNIASIS